MAISKAQQKAVAKYSKDNYDQVHVRVPKGRRDTIESMAKERGTTTNALVNALLCREAGLSMEEWKNTGE